MAGLAGIRLNAQLMDIVTVGTLIQRVVQILANILLIGIFIGTLGSITKDGGASSKVMDVLEGYSGSLTIRFHGYCIRLVSESFESCVDTVRGLTALMTFNAQVGID